MAELTAAQIEQITERTRAERKAQGLPEIVEDPSTLAKIARLATIVDPEQEAS